MYDLFYSILKDLIKLIIPKEIKLNVDYDPKEYSIKLNNVSERKQTIMGIKINDKDLLTNFSIVEINRKFPFKIGSGQSVVYRLIITKTDEHPVNYEISVKRRFWGIKKFDGIL